MSKSSLFPSETASEACGNERRGKMPHGPSISFSLGSNFNRSSLVISDTLLLKSAHGEPHRIMYRVGFLSALGLTPMFLQVASQSSKATLNLHFCMGMVLYL